jgi:hypothetical protein
LTKGGNYQKEQSLFIRDKREMTEKKMGELGWGVASSVSLLQTSEQNNYE